MIDQQTNVYGYVNNKPVYNRTQYILKSTHRTEEITDDEALIEYARKCTSNWYSAGHHHSFTSYYLGFYCLDEPMRSMTTNEYERLKVLQKEHREKLKREDEARMWRKINTIHWADNSIEEIWQDKDGIKKSVIVTQPHGDACY